MSDNDEATKWDRRFGKGAHFLWVVAVAFIAFTWWYAR